MALLRSKTHHLSLLSSSLSHLLRPRSPLAAVGCPAPSLVRQFRTRRSIEDDDLSLPLKPPTNWGIRVVPQQTAFVVERLGKYLKTLHGGIHLLIPIIDKIAYVHSLKEESFSINNQTAFTLDNVSILVDGLLYVMIVDPIRASYGVKNPILMVRQLAQTTVRSELGKLELDTILKERDKLNLKIVATINEAAANWGVTCLRYEIQDISPPPGVKQAMEMQLGAERKKRAQILEAEGEKESLIKVAEANKQSTVLAAEANKQSTVLAAEANMQSLVLAAEGESNAIRMKAEATAEGIQRVSEALSSSGGSEAANLRIAEQYIQAFGRIAKRGNTLLLPSGGENSYSMLTQAMCLFKALNENISLGSNPKAILPVLSGNDTKSDAVSAAKPNTDPNDTKSDALSAAKSNSDPNVKRFSLQSPQKPQASKA